MSKGKVLRRGPNPYDYMSCRPNQRRSIIKVEKID